MRRITINDLKKTKRFWSTVLKRLEHGASREKIRKMYEKTDCILCKKSSSCSTCPLSEVGFICGPPFWENSPFDNLWSDFHDYCYERRSVERAITMVKKILHLLDAVIEVWG